jgi:hypothetical protein
MWFRILLGLDIVAAAIVVYFFLIGLVDGSVSSFNMGLWLAILLGVGAVIGGGIALRRNGYVKLANLVLLVLAIPAFFYGLFILVVVFSGARWN